MEQSDLTLLAQSHTTRVADVQGLILAGVGEEEVDDILGLRDTLSMSRPGRRFLGSHIEDTVSISAMVNAYQAVSGDLDLLTGIIFYAQRLVGTDTPRQGDHTKALHKAVELFQQGRIDFDEL